MKLSRLFAIVVALGLGASLYIGLATLGYGNDNDTYRMLATWQVLVEEGRYEPSRFQGYLVPELIIGLMSRVLGPCGSNLTSVVFAVGSLLCLFSLLTKVGTTQAVVGPILFVAANPHWILAATTSIDYMYAICFFLLGILALVRGRPLFAALIFAAAVSSRITYFPMMIGAFAVAGMLAIDTKHRHSVVRSSVFCVALCCLAYVPAFVSAGYAFDILGAAQPVTGGMSGRVARTVYKSLYLLGVPTSMVLLALAVFRLRGGGLLCSHRARVASVGCISVIAYQLLLFFLLPTEVAYLLPVIPAIAVLLLVARPPRAVIAVMIALQVVYGAAKIELVDVSYRSEGPTQPTVAEDARPTVELRKGVLLADLERRTRYQAHFMQKLSEGRLPSLFGMTHAKPIEPGESRP